MESKLASIQTVVDELSGIPGLMAVILYGSYARGDFHEGSDIDLFIIFSSRESMKKGHRRVVRTLSKSHTFFQANVRSLEELKHADPYFLQVLFAEGKVLYRHPSLTIDVMDVLKLRPHVLVEYSLERIPAPEKCKVIFTLFGRKAAKYRYKGIIEGLGGWKVGRSCFAVPISALPEIDKTLTALGVSFTTRLVWATS
ncbi:MAG: nucleotidyltransferase domain-containing protein [Candidatus Bathyarchaeia archaeon]